MTSSRNHRAEIGIVLYPNALLSAVYGLTDQFAIANACAAKHGTSNRPPIRVTHWQLQAGKVTRMFDSHPEDAASEKPLFLIVPPSMVQDPLDHADIPAYTAWLAARHAHGTAVGSVCAGSFLLAEAGLLHERTATTHWSYVEAMAARYPQVNVNGAQLLIDDGDIITAGGMMAWTDLGLRFIQRLMGPTIMMEVARFMLVDPPGREQRYYSSFSPQLHHGDAAILKVQHWLQKLGGAQASIASMAARGGLEERTFLRRFQKATGLKPTAYCQQLRVGKAREMLEFSNQSIEQIAWAVGYEDTGAFRKIFQKITGLAPGEYRSRFSALRA